MSAGPTLVKSRFFFLGLIGGVLAVVAFFNRDALFSHPAARPAPAVNDVAVPPDTPVEEVTFAIFDTETTGTDPFIDRIIELGMVVFRGGEKIAERNWLINPERFIPKEAEDVHGIGAEMVADQPVFSEIYPEFIEMIKGAVLVAHNAPFDLAFLRSEMERAQLPIPPNSAVDSLKLFRTWYPGQDSYRLEKLAQMMHVKSDGTFHRAKDDAIFDGRILYKAFEEKGPGLTLADLYAACGKPLYI